MKLNRATRSIFSLIAITLLIACGTVGTQAQLMAPLSVPQASEAMPEWARLLYAKPINLLRIDSAYEAYYRIHAVVKDNYTKYYKRLRKLYLPFMQADGTIPEISPEMVLAPAKKPRAQLQSSINWTQMGPFKTVEPSGNTTPPFDVPYQCNTYAFDIAPSDPSILYAVTETGGFFKSTDKGLHWTMLESGVYSNSDAVAIHPTNPNIVYVGISGGVLKTSDGGAHWTSIWKQNKIWIYDLEVHATQSNIIYAATDQGFYRSVDGGTTWEKTLSNTCCDLETKSTNHNEVYTLRLDDAKHHYELWKSTDGAKTFSLRSSGWLTNVGSAGGGRMTVSPADPNRVYVVLLCDSSRPYILRSDDAAEHWRVSCRGASDSLKMNNGQGYYDLSIVASHTNADHVIVATTTAYRSTNGGQTFPTAIGGYTGSFWLHPDIQEMKASGSDCYIATDGGFSHSSDFFDKDWECRTTGLSASDFWGFDQGWNEDVVVGGRYHNGNTAWVEGYGTSYLRLGGGEAATGYVNPMNARHSFFSDIGGVDLPADASSKKTSHSVGLFPNESYYPMECSEMRWDPRCASVVYIGNGASLMKSVNNGKSYTTVWTSPDAGAEIQHIEISRSNPKVMYVSQRSNTLYDGKIWKSADEGATWTALPPFPATGAAERRVMKIALSGSNENVLYAALIYAGAGNRVFGTVDGGKTWKNLTTDALSKAAPYDIISQYGTADGVYLACAYGQVFYRNSTMSDWALHGTGLPYGQFTRNLKVFYRDNKIRSASNLGIWEAPLYEHSKPQAQPMVDKRSTACERDTFYFDDYSALERANARWHWSFPGASYVSDSTVRNPRVVYSKPGEYAVTLEVANDYGVDSKSVPAMIEVLPSVCGLDSLSDRALSLDSKTDLGVLPPIPLLATNRGLTVCCWLKLDTIQQSFSQILSNWSSDVGFSFGFSFQGYRANTNLTFYWKNVPYQLTSPFNLPVDEWVHVAISIEKSKVTLYANGVPWVYTNANADFEHFDVSKQSWEIGGGLPGQGGNYRGQIEELRMYRRALDSTEIREQMHLVYHPGITPDTIVFESPVAYYQFNEKSDERCYDRMGTSHMFNSGGHLVHSTAPVARGRSYTAIMNAGSKSFGDADLYRSDSDRQLVVVSRLDAAPDSVPQLKTMTRAYWIIRNFGSKALTLDSLALRYVGALSAEDLSKTSNFQIWKRSLNVHRNLWSRGPNVLHADSTSRVLVSASDTNAIAQYIVSTIGSSPLPVDETSNDQEVYFCMQPNPAHDDLEILVLQHLPAQLSICDAIGRTVYEQDINQPLVRFSIQSWPSGTYSVRVQSQGRSHTKALRILH